MLFLVILDPRQNATNKKREFNITDNVAKGFLKISNKFWEGFVMGFALNEIW